MGNIFNNAAAMKPFFSERVAIMATRSGGEVINGTYAASVFPIEEDLALGEASAETKRKKISVMVAKIGSEAWNYESALQVGDLITLESGVSFKIYKVGEYCDSHWAVEARQV